jgi:2Fe-2S ferredoxin
MSVEITFLPQGRSGLVANNTFVVDAARRLGVEIPTDCGRRGECDSCTVFIDSGESILSPVTAAENQFLGAEKLARGGRLACQARVVHDGSVVVRSEIPEKPVEPPRDITTDFKDLPLSRKVSTLFEFEAVTLFQALNELADVPYKAVGKVLDFAATRGKKLSDLDRQQRHQTVEHPAEAQESEFEN